ncbi:uncharacterized protein EHS24_008661 [Apiotrichum porosum]|uniref:CFA20 domain-containing protein n=1 Tax=Apiotrichum porosum TaxID=105984 RepID=A0A427XQU9_9TREE|nr:uncharacterized protein EHS24_008661 [Apiotrichum porosum]RSH81224.1 hypothetical protein EHS24_008661 [Apiotrichum porosum]
MNLLIGAVQPSLLTLLNSESEPPLALWRKHEGRRDESFVDVLDDTAYPATAEAGPSRPPRSAAAGTSVKPSTASVHVPKHAQTGSLASRVVHIQSPRPDTWIQAGDLPPSASTLGIELPWFGIQFKPLGVRRRVTIELGLVDARGRVGVVRLSSHKTEPTLYAEREPPLVHLPLALPADTHKVTDWAETGLHLTSLVALFRSLPAAPPAASDSDDNDDEHGSRKRRRRPPPRPARRPADRSRLPEGGLAYTAYVRIYANCRLRRVWFSEEGDKSLDMPGVRDEWALYAAE